MTVDAFSEISCLNRPKMCILRITHVQKNIFKHIKTDQYSPYKYLQNAKKWRGSVEKWLRNVKLYIWWGGQVSAQIPGSKYIVTSITSQEQKFDISITSHSILGGFFLFERYYLPPHFEPFIVNFRRYLVK